MILQTALPSGWEWSTIEQIADNKKNAIVDGPFGSNLKTSDYVDDGIPVLQGKNITNNQFKWFEIRYISESKAHELSRSSVYEGDIIIVKIGSIGYSAELTNLEGYPFAIIPANLAKVSLNPQKVSKKYILHWLASNGVKNHLLSIASKTAQPALSLSKIKSLPVPLPPIEEQKRIAAILDKADAIRQKRQQALALADDFLRSVFLDMFGDPVTNPLGWKTGSLIDFGDFKNGLNYTSSEAGEEVFCIGVGDFKSLDRIEGVSSLSKINLSSLPKNDYFVDEGDILFVRSNGNKELVGRNVIVYPEGSKVTFSGFCIRYRINDKSSLSNLYLSHCLKTPSMRNLLLSGGQGANIQNISQKTLSELTIPIPSIDMQNTYNEIVNGHQRLIKKSNDDFLKSYELFNSISKKAFSGQL